MGQDKAFRTLRQNLPKPVSEAGLNQIPLEAHQGPVSLRAPLTEQEQTLSLLNVSQLSSLLSY